MRISNELFFSKLKYELKFRKKEFTKLCTNRDYNYNAQLKEHDFYQIIKNFTSYLSEQEIFRVMDSFLVKDRINYAEIINYPVYENFRYQDPFLQHLNKKFEDEEKSNEVNLNMHNSNNLNTIANNNRNSSNVNVNLNNSRNNSLNNSRNNVNNRSLSKERKDDNENPYLKYYQSSKLQNVNVLNSNNNNRSFSNSPNKNLKITNTSKDKSHLKPISNYNDTTKEENFKIKIAKNIFDFIIKTAPKGLEKQYLKETMKRFDFDNNDLYTIGELMHFLNFCQIRLAILDLRYLYEQCFILNNSSNTSQQLPGKFSISDLESFITIYSKKIFIKAINTDFDSINKNDYLTNLEKEEERQLDTIISHNYFFKILEDALKVLGKDFILNYFSNHLERVSKNINSINKNNTNSSGITYLINSVWFEIGFKNLGYDELTSSETGEFKFFCIKKNFSDVENQDINNIKIDINKLLDYVIQYFKIDIICVKETEHMMFNNNMMPNNGLMNFFMNDKTTNRLCSVLFKDMGRLFIEKILGEVDEQNHSCYQPENKKLVNNKEKRENQISKKIISNQTKFKPELSEFIFRRQFIHTFGFVDHTLMNHFTSFLYSDITKNNNYSVSESNSNLNGNMNKKNSRQKFPTRAHFSTENLLKNSFDFEKTVTNPLFSHKDISNDNQSNSSVFKINNVNSKKWIQLCFNFLFLGIIKNADQSGVLIDEEDKIVLNTIADKIKRKIYPTIINSNKMSNDFNDIQDKNFDEDFISLDNILSYKSNTKPIDVYKYLEESKKEQLLKTKNDLNNFNDFKNIRENVVLNKQGRNSSKSPEIKYNNSKDNINPNLSIDNVNLIPVKSGLNANTNNNSNNPRNNKSDQQNSNIINYKLNISNRNKHIIKDDIYNTDITYIPPNNQNLHTIKDTNKKYNKQINVQDSISILYDSCVNFLVSKFDLTKNYNKDKKHLVVKEDTITKLGACRLFKEMINNHFLTNKAETTSYDSVLSRIKKKEFLDICLKSDIDNQLIEFFDYYLKKKNSSNVNSSNIEEKSMPILSSYHKRVLNSTENDNLNSHYPIDNYDKNVMSNVISSSNNEFFKYKGFNSRPNYNNEIIRSHMEKVREINASNKTESNVCLIIIRGEEYIVLSAFWLELENLIIDFLKMIS